MKRKLDRSAITFALIAISLLFVWNAEKASADDLAPRNCRVADRGCDPVPLSPSPNSNNQDLIIFVVQARDSEALIKIQMARQRLQDLQSDYENQYRSYRTASDQIDLEDRRKRGEWETVQRENRDRAPQSPITLVGTNEFAVTGVLGQVPPNHRVINENGRALLQTKVRYSPENSAAAKRNLIASEDAMQRIRASISQIISDLRSLNVGTMAEHLDSQMREARALVDESQVPVSARSVVELVEQIDQRLQKSALAQKICRKTESDHSVVEVPTFDGLKLHYGRVVSLSEQMTPAQKQILANTISATEVLAENLVKHAFQKFEPEGLTPEQIAEVNSRLATHSDSVKGLAFCRGVLSIECFQAYSSQPPSNENSQMLAVALDRASLTNKLLLLFGLQKSLSDSVFMTNESILQLRKNINDSLKTSDSLSLLATLEDLAFRGEVKIFVQVFTVVSDSSALTESDQKEALRLAKRVLVSRPNEDLWLLLLKQATDEDIPFLFNQFSRLTSQAQLRTLGAIDNLLIKWKQNIQSRAEAAVKGSTGVNFTDGVEGVGPWSSLESLLAQSMTDQALNSTPLRTFAERIERTIAILPSGSLEQQRLAIALSDIYLVAFGDTDRALAALSLYAGPSSTNYQESVKSLPSALRRILDVRLTKLKAMGTNQLTYRNFVEHEYSDAVASLQADALSDADRLSLLALRNARLKVETELDLEALSASERERVFLSKAKALIQQWTAHFADAPKEWIDGFKALELEVTTND